MNEIKLRTIQAPGSGLLPLNTISEILTARAIFLPCPSPALLSLAESFSTEHPVIIIHDSPLFNSSGRFVSRPNDFTASFPMQRAAAFSLAALATSLLITKPFKHDLFCHAVAHDQ